MEMAVAMWSGKEMEWECQLEWESEMINMGNRECWRSRVGLYVLSFL